MSRVKIIKVPKKVKKVVGFENIYKLDKELALGDNKYASRDEVQAAIDWLIKELQKVEA